MRDAPCGEPLGTPQLLSYWLHELEQREAEAVENHLFECSACSTSLERLVELADGVRVLLERGEVAAALSPSFVQHMRSAGLRIREYRLQPQTSVNCTVTPDDDLVLAHLHASLADVRQLDAIIEEVEAGSQTRLVDLAFNPADGEIVYLPRTNDLRPIQQATQRVRLIAADENGERTLGVYTFNHRASTR